MRYLSHVECWRRTLAATDPNARADARADAAAGEAPGASGRYSLIFEDDVVLQPDFRKRAAAAVAELEADPEVGPTWDVLMLGALGCVHPEGKHGLNRINSFISGGGRRARRVTERIYVPRRPYGCHAYLLSHRGAAKLMARASLANWHVDGVAWGIRDLNLYCVAPLLAHQAFVDPSTLGATMRGLEARIPRVIVDEYTKVAWDRIG